jgi:uncharacterized protein YndB with AHSA1/START domain
MKGQKQMQKNHSIDQRSATIMSTATHFFRPDLRMNPKMYALLMTAILTLSTRAQAAESQLADGFINAPLAEVWRIFTTPEGYKSTGVNAADIDLRIGGHIRTHSRAGELGDAETMDAEILAFDPEHMLALRVVHAPEGMRHRAALAGTWTVTYFDGAGENMTRVRVVGVGFTNDPESQALRSDLEKSNRELFDRAAKRFWPKCAHCQLESPLAPEQ